MFELTMPGRNTWNGVWSGDGKRYLRFLKVDKRIGMQLVGCEFSYKWNDGWSANIKVSSVPSKEKAKLIKKSAGFCGYEWMINSITEIGKIKTETERKNDLLLSTKTRN
jgi:hypothetical protein